MTNKQIFTHYRHFLGFQKFPKYLKNMKEEFPNQDLHHLCGAIKGKKFTDALIIPLMHEEHLNQAEKHKADYFVKYFMQSLAYFIDYTMLEYGIKFPHFKINPFTELPLAEDVKNFIQKIHDLECGV